MTSWTCMVALLSKRWAETRFLGENRVSTRGTYLTGVGIGVGADGAVAAMAAAGLEAATGATAAGSDLGRRAANGAAGDARIGGSLFQRILDFVVERRQIAGGFVVVAAGGFEFGPLVFIGVTRTSAAS